MQWKQGVVIHMMLYTSLLYHTTPIHCTPLLLHPPVMNTQERWPQPASEGRVAIEKQDLGTTEIIEPVELVYSFREARDHHSK